MPLRTVLAAAAAATLLLAACSGDESPDPGSHAGEHAHDEAAHAEHGAHSTAQHDLLIAHGLEEMNGPQIVDHLDQLPEERPLAIQASVRVDELLLSDGQTEIAMELPSEEFYFAVAPFVNSTHDCFYHSLSGCQGELVEETVQISIVADDGTVLVEEEATTYRNGFLGYWLPRDVSGTVTVEYDGQTGEVDFSTDTESPTCVTTLQLSA